MMLYEIGLLVKKPRYKAWQHDSKAVEKWMNEDYSNIAKKAKKHKAEIYFQNKAGVSSDYHAVTAWGGEGSDTHWNLWRLSL